MFTSVSVADYVICFTVVISLFCCYFSFLRQRRHVVVLFVEFNSSQGQASLNYIFFLAFFLYYLCSCYFYFFMSADRQQIERIFVHLRYHNT
ncbi:hypothetical protein BN77_p40059 [Rhizobium mesoamericanum STM3625]|uniref:Transmembrane protein n=1 Tax=Rhizobium mesoamericanum STM3625 TaxID=1211777 RepID=K0Q531_9HYPH|nr:hypothetical protein BN77_p40059 [Rhizobium mesoamericanum STM3625]